ncbi:MAG: EAL domain-containing protein [Snowella sp.]|nr:EAL domain-containing protein [Snowella sp.]
MQTPLYEEPRNQRFHAGEDIFKEGDRANFAYIIQEGEVEIWTIVNEKRLVLNILKTGSLFGELALVDNQPRSASATALTDCLLVLVTTEQVNQRIQEADPILQMLLWVVMRHFRSETRNFRNIINNINNQEKLTLEQLNLENQKKIEASKRVSDAVELIRMEGELKTAIKQQQFHLVYQPIVNLKTNQITGFEALIRWHSPERGYVYPDVFIPLAESTSLIIPIGKWVIKQGLQDLKVIEQAYGKPLFMSFNIATRQIEDPDFIDWILSAVQEVNIPPSQIKLELLERILFKSENTLAWVYNCRSEGFLLALDDFGTGYSSLQYLNEFNLDSIKIDKSFVQGLGIKNNSQSICQAIINLALALNMTVVAEGIETETHLAMLRDMGCCFGQGYYFSKPVPLEQAIALVDRFN